jgi:hypothetical protein
VANERSLCQARPVPVDEPISEPGSCWRLLYDPNIPTSLTWFDRDYRGPWRACTGRVRWTGIVHHGDGASRWVYACDEHTEGLEELRSVD